MPEESKTICGLVNLTVRCNQDCLFCCDGEAKGSGYHLSLEEARQRIEGVRTRGATSVTLIGGEPLVRKDIVEIVAYAASLGLRVGLTSNGTALTAGLLRKLVAAGLTSIEISIHGVSPDLVAAVSRRSFTAARQARAMELLGGMEEGRPGVSVNFVVFSRNWHELPAVARLVATRYRFVDELFVNFVDPVGYPGRDPSLVPRYSDVKDALTEAFSIAGSAGTRFTVDSVPGCMLGRHFLVLRATRERLRGVLYAKDTLDVVTHEPDPDISQYQRVPACSRCAINALCPGVNFRYLAIHGDSEFTPVERSFLETADIVVPHDVEGLVDRERLLDRGHADLAVPVAETAAATGSAAGAAGVSGPEPEYVVRLAAATNNRYRLAPDEEPAAEVPRAADVARFLGSRARGLVRLAGGEPTLRPDLAVVVKAATLLGHRVELSTNGRRFAYAQYASGLVDSGLHRVRLLLHSASARTHDAMVGADSHGQALQGLRNLRQLGVHVTVAAVVCRANRDELPALASLCAQEGAGLHLVPLACDPDDSGADRSGLALSVADAARSIASGLESARSAGVPADRVTFEGLGCCLMAASRGMEVRPLERLPSFPDVPPRGARLPAACLRCDLARDCCVVPAGLVERFGSAGLRPVGAAYSSDIAMERRGTLPRFDVDACARGPSPLPLGVLAAVVDRGSDLLEVWQAPAGAQAREALAAKNARGFVRDSAGWAENGSVLTIHPACRKCLKLHRCAAVFSASFEPERETASFASSWRKRRLGAEDAGPAADAGESGSGSRAVDLAACGDVDGWLDRFVEASKPGDRVEVRSRFPVVWLGPAGADAPGLPSVPWWVVDRAKGRRLALHSYDIGAGRSGGEWSLTFQRRAEVPPDWYYERLGTVFILSECPSRCIMCSVRKLYEDRLTPLPTVFRVLEEFRLCGYTRIDYFGGEPTVRDDLPDIIRYATSLDCYSDIITNGMLMTREVAQRLGDAGLSLAMVSLDAPDGALHDEIRGVPGAYEKALKGLSAILEQPGVEVNIDSVILPQNYRLMGRQVALAARLKATHVNLFFCVCGPIAAPKPMWLNREQLEEFYRKILPEIRASAKEHGITFTLSPDIPDKDPEPHMERISSGTYNPFWGTQDVCAGPLDEIYVTLQGDVFPCTSPTILETEHVVGNIFEKSLIEILRDVPMREFGRVAGHVEACRMCFRCHVEPRIERRFEDARSRLKDKLRSTSGDS